MQQVCERMVTVTEEDLQAAIGALVGNEHLIAEGAGAASVAAVASKRVDRTNGPVVAIISGSNIDVEKLAPLLR
jgi:threonine dehydratase